MNLIELIKLIPKGLKNPDKVLEGWINDIKLNNGDLPEEKVKEIINRRSICHSCPYMSENAKTSKAYKDLMGKNYEGENGGKNEHCSFCGCPIKKLTASLESNCGLEHYNEENKNNQQPLKWIKK